MAKGLPYGIRLQKNAIATEGSWLILVDLYYPGSSTPDKRYVNNNENVTYPEEAGNTYTAVPFTISQIKESMQGDLPKAVFTLYDVDLDLKDDLQTHDGLSGGKIEVRKVFFWNSMVPRDTQVIEYFTILDTTASDTEISFNIGVSTPLTKRFPRDRYVSVICRHRFRDGMCQFTGGELTGTDIAFIERDDAVSYIHTSDADDYAIFRGDQTIRVSGSDYNDGDYKINYVTRSLTLNHTYINLDDSVTLTGEGASKPITITVICDKTISSCRANNNSYRYGGSPGVAEGIYG